MACEVTIKDIAKAAGVSVATVSRVINDNYPVSKEARERVQQVMQELHYRPNAITLLQQSSAVGLLFCFITRSTYRYASSAEK